MSEISDVKEIRKQLEYFKACQHEGGWLENPEIIEGVELERNGYEADIKAGDVYTITVPGSLMESIQYSLWLQITGEALTGYYAGASAGELMADYLYLKNLTKQAKRQKQ